MAKMYRQNLGVKNTGAPFLSQHFRSQHFGGTISCAKISGTTILGTKCDFWPEQKQTWMHKSCLFFCHILTIWMQIMLTRGVGGSLMCGGSIVGSNKVITAGHCCDGWEINVVSHCCYQRAFQEVNIPMNRALLPNCKIKSTAGLFLKKSLKKLSFEKNITTNWYNQKCPGA